MEVGKSGNSTRVVGKSTRVVGKSTRVVGKSTRVDSFSLQEDIGMEAPAKRKRG
ncbi:hypothetical protein B484DRAFT_443601 [Ochromonadaceae sp. CCMP2298]|nr:hypothetical protein B484DRAFT_443601 [Ochromonadaceae sp. CCMP2298]